MLYDERAISLACGVDPKATESAVFSLDGKPAVVVQLVDGKIEFKYDEQHPEHVFLAFKSAIEVAARQLDESLSLEIQSIPPGATIDLHREPVHRMWTASITVDPQHWNQKTWHRGPPSMKIGEAINFARSRLIEACGFYRADEPKPGED